MSDCGGVAGYTISPELSFIVMLFRIGVMSLVSVAAAMLTGAIEKISESMTKSVKLFFPKLVFFCFLDTVSFFTIRCEWAVLYINLFPDNCLTPFYIENITFYYKV
ncbi:MAG: hypothetical protein FWE78_04300 [Methanimicrococcus sp.]|nr:hypothetical protein [Methanimicrococcus sp.]